MSDSQSIQASIKQILNYIGEEDREGIEETPARIVKFFQEWFNPEEPKITLFSSKEPMTGVIYDQMIVSENIKYYTFCEHHFLPFFGTVKIGYIPEDKIIGLSKLSRIVDYYSRRLNTQEYFTQNIANYINNVLYPKGVGVLVTGRHLCKEMRGARSKGEMITSCLKGCFFKPAVKEEFFKI